MNETQRTKTDAVLAIAVIIIVGILLVTAFALVFKAETVAIEGINSGTTETVEYGGSGQEVQLVGAAEGREMSSVR